jgi:hypothetical protein
MLIIILLLLTPSESKGNHNYYRNDNRKRYHSNPRPYRVSRGTFNEADSYFDEYQEEHLVDDYGYCEECDDYHDDF